jgi:hypothetical protein
VETTVIIRSINRPTVINAVESAKREGLKKILVVGDGVWPSVPEPDAMHSTLKVLSTGRRYHNYGYMSLNLGALTAETEFVTVLDDDDEFAVGAGNILRSALKEKPNIDIWIPGLQFNNGMILCKDKSKGLVGGNVACPTYRTEIFTKLPFNTKMIQLYPDYSDYIHVMECVKEGYKVDWLEKILILVRPKLEGTNGRGK